ncbi:MAG: phosphoribosyltransferase family protein [Bacteroidia bacterium]|nr:phosphoribosyltransferase family protein [Bacteroidia bacterium]MDW8133908.1 phosphoribosyltransferase family protein [Bacteroidia bacterium]
MSYKAYSYFLWEAGIVSIRTNPPWFQWTSGRESPIYVDHRRVLGYPFWCRWIVEELTRKLRFAPSFQAVVGVATGGIPWAAWLSAALGLPLGYIRSEPKAHGMGRQIEGLPKGIGPILLVEDLLSTGGSASRAIATLEKEGFPIAAVATLWSYAGATIASLPYPLYVLLTFPQALSYWEHMGLLSPYQVTFLWRWYKGEIQL